MAERRNDWNDFQWFIQTYLPRQRVAELRQFVAKIEQATRVSLNLRSQERKADLLTKIENAFRVMKQNNDLSTYSRVRYECEMLGQPRPTQAYTAPQPAPRFGGVPVPSHKTSNVSSPGIPSTSYVAPYPSSSSSSWPRPESSANNLYNRGQAVLQDWKASPMWKPIKALTNMEPLPDIAATENSHIRREKRAHFTLTPEIIQKLDFSRSHPSSHPHASIRIFCTSSDYYRPLGTPLTGSNAHVNNRHMPIEFPNNPDVSIDELGVPFKERGLRGKAGSAPPLDVEKSRHLTRAPGRMISVSFGHTGPTTGKRKDLSKRFWYQVVYTEMMTKDDLLNHLLQLAPTSAQDVRAEFRSRQNEDDDIIVGTATMSLKDPLSMLRITRPIRSKKCTHRQCFDAKWWIENNAVHPLWLCPLPMCNKELNFDDMIVDGSFLEIIASVPEEVDEVIIESDGQWHTADKKYGSKEWLDQQSDIPAKPQPIERQKSLPPPTPEKDSEIAPNKRKYVELLSESEDEEEPLANGNSDVNGVKGQAHPSGPPPLSRSVNDLRSGSMFNGRSTAESSSTPSSQSHHVIDLTLSDSDDDGDDQASFRLPGTVHSHPNVAGSSHPPLGTVARANGGFNSMSSPISVSASPTTPTYSKYGPPVHPANPLSSREIPLDLQDRYLPPPKSGTGYHDYATYRPPPTRPHHPRDRTQDGQHYDGWSR